MTEFAKDKWGPMIKELSDMKESLTPWEREFVSSLTQQKARFGAVANGLVWTPTTKQQNVMEKILKDRTSSPWDT